MKADGWEKHIFQNENPIREVLFHINFDISTLPLSL